MHQPPLLRALHPSTPLSPAEQVTTSVLQRVRTHQPSPFLQLMTDLLMFFSDTYATGGRPPTVHSLQAFQSDASV